MCDLLSIQQHSLRTIKAADFYGTLNLSLYQCTVYLFSLMGTCIYTSSCVHHKLHYPCTVFPPPDSTYDSEDNRSSSSSSSFFFFVVVFVAVTLCTVSCVRVLAYFSTSQYARPRLPGQALKNKFLPRDLHSSHINGNYFFIITPASLPQQQT